MKRWLRALGDWFDARLSLRDTLLPMLRHPIPREVAGPMGWWYVFGSASLTLLMIQIVTGIGLALVYVPAADKAYDSLLFLNYDVAARLVSAGAALLRRLGHGRPGPGAHDPGLSARRLQVPPRADLGHGRVSAPVHAGHVLHGPGAALGPGRLLGPGGRRVDGRASAGHRAVGGAACSWAAR